MKKFIYTLLITLLFNCSYAFAQGSDTESNDSINVYFQSFELFCKHVEKYFPDTKQILLEENALTTKAIPSKVGKLEIRLISQSDLKSEFKKKGSDKYLTKIVPLRMKDGIFFINIIPFKVAYKKRNLRLINGGAFVTNYEYDCDKDKLELKNLDGGFNDIN